MRYISLHCLGCIWCFLLSFQDSSQKDAHHIQTNYERSQKWALVFWILNYKCHEQLHDIFLWSGNDLWLLDQVHQIHPCKSNRLLLYRILLFLFLQLIIFLEKSNFWWICLMFSSGLFTNICPTSSSSFPFISSKENWLLWM